MSGIKKGFDFTLFDKLTMQIVEIVKATPDSIGEYYDFPMKLYADLVVEAVKHGISPNTLASGLNQLPRQGLASVYRSQSGEIHGVIPTPMFNNLFS